MAKILQLLRSNTVYASKDAAIDALSGSTFLNARKDGEIVLARYYYGEGASQVAKSIMGIYHVNVPLDGSPKTSGVTILEDNSTIDDVLAGLDYNLEADDNKVVTDVNQENGLVSAASKNLTEIKLDGYTVGGDDSGKIAATDTLGGALGKLQGQINGMDKAESAVAGQVVTTIAEADGKVSETKANVKDLQLGGYSKDANASGAIGSTDTVNTALSKIENTIAKNTVSSADKTVKIDTTGATTDLAVNIDGTTLVKNSSTGVIKADLSVAKLTEAEVTALSNNNVAEAYKLIYTTDTNRTAIGDVVKIYKDSALKEVYLGASTDTIDATTGVITKNTVTDPQSMNFAYHLADGTYSLTKIDVSKFLTESEFGDGLQVDNAVVSVKIDSESEEDGQTTPVEFLTVGANGIKINGIKDEIARQINLLDVTDTAVTGQYVSAVSEADGKITVTRADVSGAVLNNYSKGNVGTAVVSTDTINEAISKLENQVDNAKAAATTVVAEGTDAGNNMSIAETTDSTDGHKTYTINLTDVASAQGLANEITRAGNAETSIDSVVGLTKDANSETRTYTNTGTYIGKETTNTVKSDIKALDTEVANGLNSVTGSNAITVGTKSNKDQTISLKLDSTTATTDQTLTGTNALQITSGGLFLSSTWDCGTFGD